MVEHQKKMKGILVTGATGNIGKEIIHYLSASGKECEVIAAVRNVESANRKLSSFPNLKFRQFDFEDDATFDSAFEEIEILFLLRPPHISNVEKYFLPLLDAARQKQITKIVFLSVQGAEKSKVIPHNKIETLIKSMGFQYIFVRPSYFMQNLTTTLLPEIVKNKSITLPSGNAKFNWIDVKNIGEATALLINYFDKYQNKEYEITGTENKSFKELTLMMRDLLGLEVTYKSVNPLSFYFKKKREDVQSGFALVMTILHFLPRLQKDPQISDNFRKLTGKEPNSLAEFLMREKEKFS
jgi:uncharacterized protein YbjT (DUF2867 family)